MVVVCIISCASTTLQEEHGMDNLTQCSQKIKKVFLPNTTLKQHLVHALQLHMHRFVHNPYNCRIPFTDTARYTPTLKQTNFFNS